MKNLSTDFKRAIATNKRNYLAFADIVLQNNTTLNLTNAQIWSGGFAYEEVVSEDEEFTALGSAVIGTARLVINNLTEQYSDYDFTNASVTLYLAMEFPYNNTTRQEKHKIGTYTVDGTNYNGALITLTLLDNMEKFDRPYASNLTYPITLFNIVKNACDTCGVQLHTQEFPHYNFVINTKPDTDSQTYRDVIGWCATLAGCFAKCNPDGKLELKWFDQDTLENQLTILDGGTIVPWSAGDNYSGGTVDPWTEGDIYTGGEGERTLPIHYITSIYSQNIAVDDVIITGIQVTIDSDDVGTDPQVFTTGTTGYVIAIEGNKLFTNSNAQIIINYLGSQLIGLRFRKLQLTHTNDPSIEAGDIALVYDRKGRGYVALITRASFNIGSAQTLVCGASTPSRNNATTYSALTKSIVDARKLLKKQKTAWELAMEELRVRLNEKAGLYSTIEQTQSGNIYYLHDQPDLEDSAIVWKMTRDAWGVTTNYDGDDTVWNGGMTVDGDAIARILSVIGINFNWGVGGQLSITDTNDNETFFADAETGVVRIKANSFSLEGKTIEELAKEADENIDNLLISPKELSTDYWRLHGTVVRGQTDPKGGTNAIKLTPVSGGEGYIQANPSTNNPYNRNGRYKLSVWLKSSINADLFNNNPIKLYLNGIASEDIYPTTTWAKYEMTATVDTSSFSPNDLVTIGGFSSFTPSDGYDLYVYNPSVTYTLTPEETFKALTNDGAKQGIYIDPTTGDLYVNMNYLQGGIAKFGGVDNRNGRIEIYDASGNVIFTANNTGFSSTSDDGTHKYIVDWIAGMMDFKCIKKTSPTVVNYCGRIRAIASQTGNNWYYPLLIDNSAGDGIWFRLSGTDLVTINKATSVGSTYYPDRITINGTAYANAFIQASDQCLKDNIVPLTKDIIDKLKPVSFDWKKNGQHVSGGFIAQDVQEICPDLVSVQDNGYLSLDYISIIPHLVHKVQTQQKQINDLETRIAKLEEVILNG